MFQTTNQILYDIIPYPDKILICWSYPLRKSLLKPRAMGFISVSSCAYMGPRAQLCWENLWLETVENTVFFTTNHGKCGFHLWNIYGKSLEHLCNIYVRPCQTLICLQGFFNQVWDEWRNQQWLLVFSQDALLEVGFSHGIHYDTFM